MAREQTFYEFVRDYYPQCAMDVKQAEEMEALLERMGHVCNRVTWNAVCQIMCGGVQATAFGPRELRKMAEAAAAAKAPQSEKQKPFTRKRWETAAAFAKRQRKTQNR